MDKLKARLVLRIYAKLTPERKVEGIQENKRERERRYE